MKRTAEQWAEVLTSFPTQVGCDVVLSHGDAADLAALLRAMVAEREAAENLQQVRFYSTETAMLAATAARRRAEGLEP
jgi:hypothetical protein